MRENTGGKDAFIACAQVQPTPSPLKKEGKGKNPKKQKKILKDASDCQAWFYLDIDDLPPFPLMNENEKGNKCP